MTEQRTPHEILGVAEGASLEQIQDAYLFLVVTYGPDSIASYRAAEDQSRARILEEIEQAYQTLKSRLAPPKGKTPTPAAGPSGSISKGNSERVPSEKREPPGNPPGLLRRVTSYLRSEPEPKPIPRMADSGQTAPSGLTVGETLRSVRQARGLTVLGVANTTRIKKEFLEALEQDAFHLLPPGSYCRLMLIAYARALGIRPESLLEKLPDSKA